MISTKRKHIRGVIYMKNNILIGAFLALLASASWGAMFPVADAAFHYIDPFYFTILRYVPVAIMLMVILYFKEGKEAFRTEGKFLHLWFYGTMGFTVYNLLIFYGQNLLGDAGVLLASVMEALAPIITVLILWLVFRNRPHGFTIFTIIGAFIGVLFVVTNGNFASLFGAGRLVPLFILFFAAMGWAFYTMGGSEFPKWSVLRYSTLTVTYGILTATVVVLILTLVGYIEVPTLANIYTIRYHMLFMIFLPGLFALLFWNKAAVMLKPINAILFINFAPVTTIIIRLIQGHTISFYEWLGVGLVSAMIILNNLYQRYLIAKEKKFEREVEEKTHYQQGASCDIQTSS